MAQTRDARSARIKELRYSIQLALTRTMNQQETLGLENLGIEKPPGKNAKHKAKAKAELEGTEPVPQDQSIKQAWRPSTVPSYQSLPIPPLGSSTSWWTSQPPPSLDPTASRANASTYHPPRDFVSNDAQGVFRYQSGQGFTPVNGPSAITHPPTTQTVQTRNPFAGPIHPVNVTRTQKKSGAGPIVQKSPLSVMTYYGLPSLRIDKQYRHSKARLQSEPIPAPLGRWTAPPPKTPQQSDYRPKKRLPSQTAEATPHIVRGLLSLTKDNLIHLPAPLPKSTYLGLAHAAPALLPAPQRLLLILDLNGTLLYRRPGHIQYLPRPCLQEFLAYALANHSVLVWSSATPKNVKGMCERLFNPSQRRLLLGEWGRDTLDLTSNQYKERVQVYKRLDRVWDNQTLQHAHPGFGDQERWGQHNTLLIDDSIIKASPQPFNHVEVPEFIQGVKEGLGGQMAVLEQVVGYVEYARRWNNVSGFVREMKFGVGEGWDWDWNQKIAQAPEGIVKNTNDEEEEGGVKL